MIYMFLNRIKKVFELTLWNFLFWLISRRHLWSEGVSQYRPNSSETWTDFKSLYRFFSLKNGELSEPSLKSFLGKFIQSTPSKSTNSIDRGNFLSGAKWWSKAQLKSWMCFKRVQRDWMLCKKDSGIVNFWLFEEPPWRLFFSKEYFIITFQYTADSAVDTFLYNASVVSLLSK